MELMPMKFLVRTRQETIASGTKGAVANLQWPLAGFEGQKSRHRPPRPVEPGQGLSQQQHAAAFGVNGQPPRGPAQAFEALIAVAELLGVLLREPTGQDQSAGLGRQWFIGQGTPGQERHPHVFQELSGFLIPEVKGLIRGHRHRQRAS